MIFRGSDTSPPPGTSPAQAGRPPPRPTMRALLAETAPSIALLGPRASWPARLDTFAALLEATPVPMCVLWGEDLLQIYNDPYAALLGDDHPISFGQPARADSRGPVPFDRQTLDPVLNGQSLSSESRTFQRRVQGHPDSVWCDIAYTPIRDDAGAVIGIQITVFDTTAQVRRAARLEAENSAILHANDSLARETAVLRGFFQQAPSFMAVLRGADHVFQLTNDSFLRLIGQLDVVGQPIAAALPELDPQPLRSLLDQVYLTGEAFVGREMGVLLRRHGSRPPEQRLIDVVLQPIADAAGVVRGIFVEGADVTQRMRAEDALRRLNETLEDEVEARTADLRAAEDALRQAQKMETVGQLTGGIAHDFNNLLGAILGGLELMHLRLANGQLDELPRYIEAATSSANRAAALTHRLLAFSRRQTLDPRPTDVAHLAGAMGELISRTVGPAIRTSITTGPSLWTAWCDPNQLEVALLNLAVNARDAMPDGGNLTISATNVTLDGADTARQADTAAGRYVAISVGDTGVGMTPSTVERAFEPFFTTKPAGQGTGLGLSMVYGFAKQSGGQVVIDSAVGRGTTTTLYLPWCIVLPQPPAQPPPQTQTRAAGERILIVDDEPVLRGLVVEIVRELGYQVRDAEGGAAALQLLHADPSIDLLVTDVGMPNMNGRQLADAARALRPDLKILFITGYVDNSVQDGGLLEPGMQVLTKPFTKSALASKIQASLKEKKA